jgi:hypothetical protein
VVTDGDNQGEAQDGGPDAALGDWDLAVHLWLLLWALQLNN